jgi:glucose/arabinose dehydrogenase
MSGPEPVEREPLLQLEVLTRSEQGLLGLAFAPDFGSSGGALYFNATRACSNAGGCTQVARVQVKIDGQRWTAGAPELLLEVAQPYANHNAGQLAFGPEGALYVGLGDGGWRDDPQGHGQDVATLLGSMLRIDPSRAEGGKPYAIPADQPKITGAPLRSNWVSAQPTMVSAKDCTIPPALVTGPIAPPRMKGTITAA